MGTLIVLTIVFLLLIAIWNGYVIVWGLATDSEIRQKANVIWHRIGWFIRVIPVLVLLYGLYPDWLAMVQIGALCLLFGHFIYNTIINIIRGDDWDYTGSTAWWDKLIGKFKVYHYIIAAEIGLVIGAFALGIWKI